jgi:hypothetical protein
MVAWSVRQIIQNIDRAGADQGDATVAGDGECRRRFIAAFKFRTNRL